MINRKCILAIEWTYLWIPLCLIRRNYGLISAISRKWQRKSLVGFRLINRRFMPTMKWTYLWFSGQLAIIRPSQCNTHTNISPNAKFHHFIRFLVALHVFFISITFISILGMRFSSIFLAISRNIDLERYLTMCEENFHLET